MVQSGYDFPHARPGFAMLKKWLPENETDLIPDYPYTFVGVGGLLIKDNKVLMVKERYAISSKWKLPGKAINYLSSALTSLISKANFAWQRP